MIPEISTLLRVKQLREEKALAWLKSRQDAVEAAKQLVKDAKEAVRENEAKRPEREAAIYAKIMRKIVDRLEIDQVSADIQELDNAHQRLVDKVARAQHTLEKRETELAEAYEAHQEAQKAVDKYELLLEEMQNEADEEAAMKEEAELEDLAGRRVAAL